MICVCVVLAGGSRTEPKCDGSSLSVLAAALSKFNSFSERPATAVSSQYKQSMI